MQKSLESNSIDFSRLHEGKVVIPASIGCLGCAMIKLGRCKETTPEATLTGGKRELTFETTQRFGVVHIYPTTELDTLSCGVGQALAEEAKKPVVLIHTTN